MPGSSGGTLIHSYRMPVHWTISRRCSLIISDDDVRSIAALARIQLEDAEIPQQRRHLEALIGHLQLLHQVDVDRVPPSTHMVQEGNRLRADRPHAPLPIDRVLANAPDCSDEMFLVPRILGD